jgi:hypothetical protein
MNVKINLSTAIHEMVATESNRYSIAQVLIDTKSQLACATDGKALAITPCEVTYRETEMDVVALVSTKLLKTGGKNIRQVELNGNISRIQKDGSRITSEYGTGLFPRVDQLARKPEKPTCKLTIDAELLFSLAKAMHSLGTESYSVCLEFDPDGGPIAVVPANSDQGSVGLLMPMSDDGPNQSRTSNFSRFQELAEKLNTRDVFDPNAEKPLISKPETVCDCPVCELEAKYLLVRFYAKGKVMVVIEDKKTISDKVDEAVSVLAADLKAGKSDQLIRYLETCARFHKYSFGNCMLIFLQCQHATHVAGFRKWLELKRFVRKGEKGIAIIAPCVRTSKPEEGSDDKPKSRVIGFRTAYVFDISQTDGEPLEGDGFFNRTGEVPNDLVDNLIVSVSEAGIEIESADELEGALGVSKGGSIAYLSNLSNVEKFSTIVHEFAHELLHRGDRRKDTTKTLRETEAEAVAHIVCHAVGIESSRQSADYIQLYNGDVELLYSSLEFVRKTASSILEGLCKSR